MVTLPVTLEVTLPGCCRDREGGLVRQSQLERIQKLKADCGVAPPGLWVPFILQGAHAFSR